MLGCPLIHTNLYARFLTNMTADWTGMTSLNTCPSLMYENTNYRYMCVCIYMYIHLYVGRSGYFLKQGIFIYIKKVKGKVYLGLKISTSYTSV